MVELVRTNDLVHLSWAQAMLEDAGIHYLVLDTHMSSVEGSIGILPRRLMVATEDQARALAILDDAAPAADDGDR